MDQETTTAVWTKSRWLGFGSLEVESLESIGLITDRRAETKAEAKAMYRSLTGSKTFMTSKRLFPSNSDCRTTRPGPSRDQNET